MKSSELQLRWKPAFRGLVFKLFLERNCMSYNTLEDLFKDYPWKTASKFIPLANRFGFTNRKEVLEFLNNKATHDKKIENEDLMLPIYSKNGGEYPRRSVDLGLQDQPNIIDLLPFSLVVFPATAYSFAQP